MTKDIDDNLDATPDSPEPIKDDELRQAFLCVNGKRFRECLDWARDSLPKDTNAWKFVTHLADKNPQKFVGIIRECSGFEDGVNWNLVDDASGKGRDLIRAIKAYREQKSVGLQDSKEAVEKHYRKGNFRSIP